MVLLVLPQRDTITGHLGLFLGDLGPSWLLGFDFLVGMVLGAADGGLSVRLQPCVCSA